MTKVHEDRPVLPTQQDEVAAAGSELIGGPLGRYARLGGHWLGPVRVVALIAIGMFALGMVQKLPCYDWAWFRGRARSTPTPATPTSRTCTRYAASPTT